MPYLLDANVFIEAKNRYYGLDFCPAFWDWLIDRLQAQVVFSIEKVGQEIGAGRDDLATWASRHGSGLFLAPPDPKMTTAMGTVSRWVVNEGFEPGAVSAFLGAADYFLVAHALAEKYIVVTHEREVNSVKKIKIPTFARALASTSFRPLTCCAARARDSI